MASVRLTHHREVGLLHLFQKDPQRLQIQNDVIGLLQPCTGREQGLSVHRHLLLETHHPSPKEAAGGEAPQPLAEGTDRSLGSPSVTFMYTLCRAGQ